MRARFSRSLSSSPARAGCVASAAAASRASSQARCTRAPVVVWVVGWVMESLLGVDGMNQTYFLKAATVVDKVAATSTVNTSTM